jgi:hypothetical protein
MRQVQKPLAVLLAALSVFLALPGRADEDRTANVMVRFDVDSATATYCRVTGQGGDPMGASLPGPDRVTTSGSSTTVTSAAGFGDLDADDIIIVSRALTTGVTDVRRVVGAPATTSSLTIDAAIDWTGGFAWRYLKQTCGTGTTDGVIDVSGRTKKRFEVAFEQGDIDGLEWRLECRGAGIGATWQVVFPGAATACGAGSVASGYCRFATATAGIAGRYSVVDEAPWQSCRIGFKYQSSDASDAAGALEIVNASITVSDVRR